jgi:hypothetical protein
MTAWYRAAVAVRWWLVIALAASCKRREKAPEPQPTPNQPASGYSITKREGTPRAQEDSAGGSAAAPDSLVNRGNVLSGVTALSVGATRACAVTSDGKAWCWQPGAAAEPLVAPGPVKALAAGTCALLEDLSVWCPPHRLELSAGGMTGAGQIAASATDYCATRRLFVWCWRPTDDTARKQFDWAGVGRLTIGDGRACSVVGGGEIECVSLADDAPRAQAIRGIDDVVALAIQGSVSCVAHTKGNVECWTDPSQRMAIAGISSATELAVGPQGDACALGGAGGVTCWRLALSPLSIERPPAQVAGITATAIGVGAGFACALGDDKATRCWSTSDGKPQLVAKR